MRGIRIMVVAGAALVLASTLAGCSTGPQYVQSAADRFQARMDAAYPKGAYVVSFGGELVRGDDGDPTGPMGSGSGVPNGDLTVTLACKGTHEVDFRLALPGHDLAIYPVTCGTDQHISTTQTTPGSIGFGASTASGDHGTVVYYAGILHTSATSSATPAPATPAPTTPTPGATATS